MKYWYGTAWFFCLLSIVATNLFAKELKVAVPYSMPPYIINSSESGIVVDIIKHLFEKSSEKLHFDFLPNHRLSHTFNHQMYDIGFAIPPAKKSGAVYYSNPLFMFKNIAVSRATDDLELLTVNDLKPLRVTAFRNAAKFLGETFANMAKSNPGYSEVTDQESQIKLLLKDRTDVIIIERRIYQYYLTKIDSQLLTGKKLITHHLFPAQPRSCAFRNEALRNYFNNALKALKNSKHYREILLNYTFGHL